MTRCILLIWTGCILAITLALLRFAWVATPRERLLVLALALTAGSAGKRRSR